MSSLDLQSTTKRLAFSGFGLREFHCQNVGGVIGNGMGLDKTKYKPSRDAEMQRCTNLPLWFGQLLFLDNGGEVNILYAKFKILCDSAHNFTRRTPSASGSENTQDEDQKVQKRMKWDKVISRVTDSNSGLFLMTYEHFRLHRDKLVDIEWGACFCDKWHRS
jgi:hypothetical protein